MILQRKEEMLDIIDKLLEDMDRTPAWLCRQAGVHRCNYTLIKSGQRRLTENMKDKFSKALGIRKDILFKQEQKKNRSKEQQDC